MGKVTMWRSKSYTHRGHVRSVNEDSILDKPDQRLWLVADGMGGHTNGDYASQLITNSLLNFNASSLSGISRGRLLKTLAECNSQLVEKAKIENSGIVGCTVALLHARQKSIICCWCGDSRIYRLRNGNLKLLTQDHTERSAVENRDLLKFPVAPFRPSPTLTNAVGGNINFSIEHCWYQLNDGDSFLLCTDGLNKEVSDEEILSVMANRNLGNRVLSELTRLYEQRGARDNIGMVWVQGPRIESME